MGQKGFWDKEKHRKNPIQLTLLLPKLNKIVPWENLRPTLEEIYEKERKSSFIRKHFSLLLK
ncbi:MAG: hypothetical protein OHK0012_20060 [Synechococcales cyanobacterium]